MMMERRSFEPEARSVGEFLRINPKGKTDRQLLIASLKQAEATHGCLEKHIAETRLAYLDATEKRQQLTEVVYGLRNDVAGVQSTQEAQGAQVRVLTLALGVEKPDAGEAKPKAHTEISWKAIGKIGVTMFGAMSGIVLFIQIIAPGLAAMFTAIMKANP